MCEICESVYRERVVTALRKLGLEISPTFDEIVDEIVDEACVGGVFNDRPHEHWTPVQLVQILL